MLQENVARRPQIVGFLDAVANRRVFGWAWDRTHPEERVEIHVQDGEQPLGTVLADRLRDDLAEIAIGDGRHAFEFELPEEVARDPSQVRVLARCVGTGRLVPLGNRTMVAANDPELAEVVGQLRGIASRTETAQRRLFRNARALLQAIEQRSGAPNADGSELDPFLGQLHHRLGELVAATEAVRRASRRRGLTAAVLLVGLIAAASLALQVMQLTGNVPFSASF